MKTELEAWKYLHDIYQELTLNGTLKSQDSIVTTGLCGAINILYGRKHITAGVNSDMGYRLMSHIYRSNYAEYSRTNYVATPHYECVSDDERKQAAAIRLSIINQMIKELTQ